MDQFILPRQALEPSEVDEFLSHLFGDIARRPEPLRLRETAAVVRFIKQLTLHGVPTTVAIDGPDAVARFDRRSISPEHLTARSCAGQIAEIIWDLLVQHGDFPIATKPEVLRFLDRHRRTYLANPLIDQAIAYVQGFELPANAAPIEPPTLRSRSRTARIYPPNARINSDLSERIYIADQTLKRAGIKKRRPVIARALEVAGVEHRSGESIWTAEDINERVKEFQRSQRLRYSSVWNGEHLVDWKISFFRFVQSNKKASSEALPEGTTSQNAE